MQHCEILYIDRTYLKKMIFNLIMTPKKEMTF